MLCDPLLEAHPACEGLLGILLCGQSSHLVLEFAAALLCLDRRLALFVIICIVLCKAADTSQWALTQSVQPPPEPGSAVKPAHECTHTAEASTKPAQPTHRLQPGAQTSSFLCLVRLHPPVRHHHLPPSVVAAAAVACPAAAPSAKSRSSSSRSSLPLSSITIGRRTIKRTCTINTHTGAAS